MPFQVRLLIDGYFGVPMGSRGKNHTQMKMNGILFNLKFHNIYANDYKQMENRWNAQIGLTGTFYLHMSYT